MASLGTIIFVAVAVLIVILIVLYIATRRKGKIEIALNQFNFSPGDEIMGEVRLKLNKPVEAKSLQVGLIGVYKNTKYQDNASRTRTGNAFEFKQQINGEKTYQAGEKSYNFKIKVPKDLLSSRALGNNMLGTIVKSAQILTGNITSIKWYVVANLQMKGFDISKKVQVNIG